MSKRIHLSKYKKHSSPAKQTVSVGGLLTKDNKVFQYEGGATGPSSKPYQEMKESDMTPEQKKWRDDYVAKHGRDAYNKLKGEFKKQQQGEQTPGTTDLNITPVMDPGQPASRVDAFSAYEMRGQARNLKATARQVGKASKKLERMKKRGANPDAIAAQEKVLKGMQSNLDKASMQSELGINRAITQGYDYTTKGLQEKKEGGQRTDTSGELPTYEQVQSQLNQAAGGATVNPNAGQSDAASAAGDIKTEITKPVTTSFIETENKRGSMATGFSRGIGMLKRSSFKMGGYGSKTYKK